MIFTLYPFVSGFYYSLADFDAITPPIWVGLDNYRRILFQDEYFWLAAKNTAWYTGVYVFPAVALGLLLAVLLNQRVRGITLFRTLFYMPSVVPSVASVALFMFVLHGRFGLLNETLYNVFGIVGPNWLTTPEWSKPALVIWSLWGVGGGMTIYLAGLQNVPDQLHEAAAIDGAGTIRRFFTITIPMISPTLLFVFVMTVIGSFRSSHRSSCSARPTPPWRRPVHRTRCCSGWCTSTTTASSTSAWAMPARFRGCCSCCSSR